MPRILVIIVSLIIMILAIINVANWYFNRQFREDVRAHFQATYAYEPELLTDEDIQHLPPPVQKYLLYTHALGKPKIRNFHVRMDGKMRQKGKGWFAFTTQQYNFIEDPGRYFYMNASLKGLPVNGYHAYGNGNASMLIKALSLIPVASVRGRDIFRAETVTFFNDLCILAPASLIDPRIVWESYDDTSATAAFTYEEITIRASLIFDEEGRLTNFISDDRIDTNDMKHYRFSTPVNDYRDFNGYRLPSYGETIWHYPDGLFTYGKFNIRSIEYNVTP